MSRALLLLVLALVATACGSDGDTGISVPEEADGATIVVNADVYTVDADMPRAEAFTYDVDGTILAVGDEATVRAEAGPDATVIDAGGALVLPGFQDAHLHVPEAGLNAELCFLPPEAGAEVYESLLTECAAEQPAATWVRAGGYSIESLVAAEEPLLDIIDRAVPDRPAVVLDDLGHSIWTNSLGLGAAGIAAGADDPQGGVFDRDPETGDLSGLLLENAQHLVHQAAARGPDEIYAGLLDALQTLRENGLTTVHDAGGYWNRGHPDAWRRARDEGTLTVRGINSLYVFPDRDIDTQLDELRGRFDDDPNDLLRFNTAKIYLDGILDLGTAALLEPYSAELSPDFPSGFLYFDPDELDRYAAELHASGFRLHFHTIGDRAVREALDAIEGIGASPSEVQEQGHRTTHTYLVDPADVSRFTSLGVTADFQMGPDAVSGDYAARLVETIGARADRLIPTRDLLDAGARVILSSDWDADPLSPLGTIARSLTRPTQAVPDLETAIRLVTIEPAHVLGHEETTGSIEVGKQADYVALSDDIFALDPGEIAEVEVDLTVVDGRIVHRR